MTEYRPGKIMMWFLHSRFPPRLYDWKLGWLFGSRLCRLTHVGRKSGKRHRTVLEVVDRHPDTGEVIVVSGLGASSNWYRNLHANGFAEIDVGGRHFAARYRDVSLDEATQIMAEYEQRYRLITPFVRYMLSKLVGWRYDGSEAARRKLVTELPMVAFAPIKASPGR